MKRTLSIVLIAVLVVCSVFGVSAAVTINTVPSTNDSVAVPSEVEPATTATEEATEVAPSEAKSDVTTAVKATAVQQTSNAKITIPTVTGVWVHEKLSGNCSISVDMQCDNTLDMTIMVSNDKLTKIAYSHVSVTLDNVYDDGATTRCEGSFEYTDSFGNEGTGIVSVSENVILLIINEEYNAGRGFGISIATGDYIFRGDGEVAPGEGPTMPELKKEWQSGHASIYINSQDGNTINFTVTAVRGNYAQIATSNITVTLDTRYDGTLVRGDADFTYVDSFGNEGTGSVAVSENVIILVVEQESEQNGVWGIGHTTGKFV